MRGLLGPPAAPCAAPWMRGLLGPPAAAWRGGMERE